METFIKAAKRSNFFLNDEVDFTPLETKWVRKSLTKLILNYKIQGNIGMFNHMMEPHSK